MKNNGFYILPPIIRRFGSKSRVRKNTNWSHRGGIEYVWGIILMLLILIFIIIRVVEGEILIEMYTYRIYNTNLNSQVLWQKLFSSFYF